MGFSPDWLALRAAADDKARAAEGLRRAAEFAARLDRPPRIVDLGAGTGAAWRATQAAFPGANWLLADADGALLAEAGRRTGARTSRVDLARNLSVLDGADLVTASAFFDLASPAWIERFAQRLPRRAALYAALTYDGREEWAPLPPHEAEGLAVFHADMRRDKGFGPAAGPDAPAALANALRRQGRAVETWRSDWRLGPDDRALIGALADGAAAAAATLEPKRREEWRDARRRASSVLIGHIDLFAAPLQD